MSEIKFVDVFENVDTFEINCLDAGFVKLVDCMPRMVPNGRTIEYAIVRNARVSYDLGLKSIKEDENLIKYLYDHEHTSPFESIEFSFHIKAPRAIVQQIERHRTGSYNEESQRYTEIKEGEFYHPLKLKVDDYRLPEGGVRMQSRINHQGSDMSEVSDEILNIFKMIEDNTNEMFDLYHRAIKLGAAKECARFALPMGTYSNLYMKMDLNNLLKFLRLRMDKHAQAEIRVYARAIYDLIKPLIPTTILSFDNKIRSVSLNSREIKSFMSPDVVFEGTRSEKLNFAEKIDYMKKISNE